MADPFVGQLMLVPFTFAPRGWALCNGQLMSIQQNVALFSLVGTFYGGNGTSTFALPNLQGIVTVGTGQAVGGSSYDLGQTGGAENVTLLQSQLPSHDHDHMASTTQPNSPSPSNANLGSGAPRQQGFYGAAPTQGNKVGMNLAALSSVGGSSPHANIQPTLTLNWIIALQGIFPSRP